MVDQQPQPKKIKMTFDEYKKYAFMIVHIMKEYERRGEDNVRQQDIVDKMVQELEVHSTDHQTSVEKSIETSKKVANVITHLINNENMLQVS